MEHVTSNPLSEEVINRASKKFWKKVSIGPECWEWRAGKDADGYGGICIFGKAYKAHRFSWALHNQKDPGNMLVLHSCDNPGCVNPEHLFLGSNHDNSNDKVSKKRHRFHENHPCVRINPLIVRICKRLRINFNWTYASIGSVFDVTPGAIWNAVNGRSWVRK